MIRTALRVERRRARARRRVLIAERRLERRLRDDPVSTTAAGVRPRP